MRKKLVIINGTMGVGKTTVCNKLHKAINNSVWLDGDWCWQMNPFVVSEENKRMVEKNIIFMLRSFLSNSSLEVVIFSWVMHKNEIFDIILAGLADLEFTLCKISLLCSERELRRRMRDDERSEVNITDSLSRCELYDNIASVKVDTTAMTAEDVVEKVQQILSEKT